MLLIYHFNCNFLIIKICFKLLKILCQLCVGVILIHSRFYIFYGVVNLDTLTISLEGNYAPYIFFAPWLRRTLGEVCLRQFNIGCAESKLVQPHTPPARVCSIVCDTSDLPLR